MKRAAIMTLSVAIAAVGFWVMTASHTLNSACTLSAQTGGGTSCVSGLPFVLLGIALAATGAGSMIFQLLAWIRGNRRKSMRQAYTAITTLHDYEVELLSDVA
jgi:hypothetical protein